MTQRTLLYFAYGRNMHLEIMAERCPAAEFVSLATLDRHRILINGRGVSTVVPDAKHRVHGVLWHLTAACEATLDEIEGVARGHYVREIAHPVPAQGPARPAMIYLAANIEPGPPKAGYLEALEEAAAAHGFPDDYRLHLGKLRLP